MYDNSAKKIEIITADGLAITLDDTNKTIKLEAPSVSVSLENNKLNVESTSDVSIKSSANLKLEASGNVDIQASGQVNIKGSLVNLN
jgi:autotransporter translocation and assembly factor TamB